MGVSRFCIKAQRGRRNELKREIFTFYKNGMLPVSVTSILA
jgi:hypothetical protein